jgi:hypothetical protein
VKRFNQRFNHSKTTTSKTLFSTLFPSNHQTHTLGNGYLVKRGSTAWSGRVIFAHDLEPIHTRLERSPTGPRLVIESETFGAILPATPFILE